MRQHVLFLRQLYLNSRIKCVCSHECVCVRVCVCTSLFTICLLSRFVVMATLFLSSVLFSGCLALAPEATVERPAFIDFALALL